MNGNKIKKNTAARSEKNGRRSNMDRQSAVQFAGIQRGEPSR